MAKDDFIGSDAFLKDNLLEFVFVLIDELGAEMRSVAGEFSGDIYGEQHRITLYQMRLKAQARRLWEDRC